MPRDHDTLPDLAVERIAESGLREVVLLTVPRRSRRPSGSPRSRRSRSRPAPSARRSSGSIAVSRSGRSSAARSTSPRRCSSGRMAWPASSITRSEPGPEDPDDDIEALRSWPPAPERRATDEPPSPTAPTARAGSRRGPWWSATGARQLKSPRWGAALHRGRLPDLANPEMNPPRVGVAHALAGARGPHVRHPGGRLRDRVLAPRPLTRLALRPSTSGFLR